MYESIVGPYFVVRARCRRKESSRSLSHLLMSFLLALAADGTHGVKCNTSGLYLERNDDAVHDVTDKRERSEDDHQTTVWMQGGDTGTSLLINYLRLHVCEQDSLQRTG